MSAATEILVPGKPGEGEALVLSAPISFWGGVDPGTGRILSQDQADGEQNHGRHRRTIVERLVSRDSRG